MTMPFRWNGRKFIKTYPRLMLQPILHQVIFQITLGSHWLRQSYSISWLFIITVICYTIQPSCINLAMLKIEVKCVFWGLKKVFRYKSISWYAVICPGVYALISNTSRIAWTYNGLHRVDLDNDEGTFSQKIQNSFWFF